MVTVGLLRLDGRGNIAKALRYNARHPHRPIKRLLTSQNANLPRRWALPVAVMAIPIPITHYRSPLPARRCNGDLSLITLGPQNTASLRQAPPRRPLL
jgi:hypothetical protein